MSTPNLPQEADNLAAMFWRGFLAGVLGAFTLIAFSFVCASLLKMLWSAA